MLGRILTMVVMVAILMGFYMKHLAKETREAAAHAAQPKPTAVFRKRFPGKERPICESRWRTNNTAICQWRTTSEDGVYSYHRTTITL